VDAADDAALAEITARGLSVVVWTVNDSGSIRRLLEFGVAAIITDFPERAVSLRNQAVGTRRPSPASPDRT
jgi:glycerophosphoryl diester phosphodiesterase